MLHVTDDTWFYVFFSFLWIFNRLGEAGWFYKQLHKGNRTIADLKDKGKKALSVLAHSILPP